MPEIVDLEVYNSNIKKRYAGKTVAEVNVSKAQNIKNSSHDKLADELTGKKLTDVTRRGKYSILHFNSKGENKLIVHLMLTGCFGNRSKDNLVPNGIIISLGFEDGSDLSVCDPSYSPWVQAEVWLDDCPKLRRLGPEPLSEEFTQDYLENILRNRRTKIKNVLIEQDKIAGIGNAYSDEVLWKARIHPAKIAAKLNDKEIKDLYMAMRDLIPDAISKVSEIANGRINSGSTTEFREHMAVHGPGKHKCPKCKSEIKTTEINRKKTYYCPRCQNYFG